MESRSTVEHGPGGGGGGGCWVVLAETTLVLVLISRSFVPLCVPSLPNAGFEIEMRGAQTGQVFVGCGCRWARRNVANVVLVTVVEIADAKRGWDFGLLV
jgi:hypothetical protein